MENIINIIVNNFPAIASAILIIVFSGYITWRISQKTKKREAIDKFRNAFIEEREKIKTFNIQNHFIQERAIFEIRRYLFLWQRFRLNKIWNDYQETENKYRQVLHTQDIPPNHLIHYGDHKGEVLSKIEKIINYLK